MRRGLHKSRPEPRALSALSLGINPRRSTPPCRPRLIKGLPAPRALRSSPRNVNKILWETMIYFWAERGQPNKPIKEFARMIEVCHD